MRVLSRKGFGKQHAKWSPVATSTYQFMPEIRINQALMNSLTLEQKHEWVASCTAKPDKPVFEINAQTQQVSAGPDRIYKQVCIHIVYK